MIFSVEELELEAPATLKHPDDNKSSVVIAALFMLQFISVLLIPMIIVGDRHRNQSEAERIYGDIVNR